MKRISKYISAFCGILLFAGCEDYLDKTPDSDLSDEQIFGNYRNFQGYLDELYGRGMTRYLGQCWTASMDMGDDVYCNKTFPITANITIGSYWWVHSNKDHNPLMNGSLDAWGDGVWPQGLNNIRRCNHALANLDLLTDATDDERSWLEGQARFFRAWNHFEIARFWGGIPWMDTYYSPNDNLALPRLSFKETLLKIAEDCRMAAELLPVEWPDMNINGGRVTKGAALAVRARALLYAASPLTVKMETGTAEYDLELADEAAKAAAEVLKLADEGVYGLVDWTDYQYNFADNRAGTGSIWTKETIFSKLVDEKGKWYVTNGIGRIHNVSRFEGNGVVTSPTANFVNLYETSTGYALEDAPESDVNRLQPWKRRDPRLLKTILVDGCKWVDKNNGADAYIQLYTGGADRNSTGASVTGYLIRKYIPYKVNKIDMDWNNYRYTVPYIRLAEMYLSYAEAVNEVYGPTDAPEFYPMTAVEAVNTVRRRVKLPVNVDETSLPAELIEYSEVSFPDVQAIYTDTREHFRDRIRNERSVELAFEGHRFHDLRRWYLLADPDYQKRTQAVFDKDHTQYQETELYKVALEEKHYWLPFDRDDVKLYEGFKQNPGW